MLTLEQIRDRFLSLHDNALTLCNEDAFREMVKKRKEGEVDIWDRTLAQINAFRTEALALFKTFPKGFQFNFHLKYDRDETGATLRQLLQCNDTRFNEIFLEEMGRAPTDIELKLLVEKWSQFYSSLSLVSEQVRSIEVHKA